MKKLHLLPIISLFLFSANSGTAQELKKLTFEEVIKLSEDQSPNALIAKHRFRTSYWQYRSFKAQYIPSLRLSGTYTRLSIMHFKDSSDPQDSSYYYIQTNTVDNLGSLYLSQNIGPTGTTISLRSDLTLEKDIAKNNPVNYITTPVSINITQPIRAYNSLKWDKKIEPKRYDTGKEDIPCCY